MPVRLPFSEYEKQLKAVYNGVSPFIINESSYHGMNQPIEVKCKKCGTKFTINRASYAMYIKGSTPHKEPPCNHCKELAKEKEFFDKLKEKFNGELPYEIVSPFKGVMKPLDVKCKNCGEIIHQQYANNLLTLRVEGKERAYCPKCCGRNSYQDYTKLQKEWENRIKELSGKDNLYTLLEPYKGNKTKIKIKCNICNYEFEAMPQNLIIQLKRSNGKTHYCPNCNDLISSDLPYPERLKKSNPNIIALEEYISLRTPILHKCTVCGNEWKSAPKNRLNGEGCPKCANIKLTSSYEDWLYDFLKKYYKGEIVRNSRKLLGYGNKYEIDIYLPDLKIGFEIDGCYYHNYDKKGANYHLMKTNLAEAQGISLYHIFTSEIYNKPTLVKDKVLSIVGVLPVKNKIYARKCEVKEISASLKNRFLDKAHIQGSDRSSINLGLIYKNKLIAVMTFAKPSVAKGQNNKSTYDYELSRFAVKSGYCIPGGFSKLFKYFERNYTWNKIITYADKRWSKGNVYKTNGFNYLHDSRPNYWYFHMIDDNTLYHRYTFNKTILKKKFPKLYSDNKSEYEIMRSANYRKVYDCGNMVFEYKNKN